MSTYQWAEAQLIFNTVEELQTAVQSLRDGGWLTDSNQILSGEDDNNLAGNGMVCIIGTTFILPSEQYLNIGRVIYDVIKEANNGYFHSNCDDGDLWIECWKDGKWVSANSYEDMLSMLRLIEKKISFYWMKMNL